MLFQKCWIHNYFMIVKRWLAPLIPTEAQVRAQFEREGLECFEEPFKAGSFIPDHRHPFDEIRMIVAGQLFYNIAGNKLLLRQGDKIIIPSNTRHSKEVPSQKDCLSICAYRAY
ncbi:MAG: cupin domain-containing protein [Bdellovibrionales bacterium]|nr:cupin domain-containing protein [Bdellovibrionales bacterium]